ncbi:unnamed protein product, partial [Allacma fusca]
EDRVSPPPKRPRKRRKAIVEEEVEQNVVEINTSENWEEEFRQNLGMSTEEFEDFTKSQGFCHQSAKLPHLFDFGVPNPKGMPKFATKIPDEYFKNSNTLRVYQNILKPSYTSGSLIFNATDQAFYKPACDNNST